ncbi:MAG: type II toxin-antitoxin system RelB/DinJ family antitoxin [Erysipelotrichales bacterium]|nr:type II toxin-antitoxin system RelB/DinJ family antitoxin [Erysipelotrichales bacterium]
MSTKTATVSMRIDASLKEDAEALFHALGMTLPQAINMFISQSLLVGGLPFESRLPQYNRDTIEAMKEAKLIASGELPSKTYRSADELFADLDSEL